MANQLILTQTNMASVKAMVSSYGNVKFELEAGKHCLTVAADSIRL